MQATPTFAQLLADVVERPGIISAAYRAFHTYSFGNMIAAAAQCEARSIPLGPLSTFMGWKDKGRAVRKGERALVLCMPITCKGTRKTEDGADEEFTFARFAWKPHWFALAQTDGQDYAAEAASPTWDAAAALAALDVHQIAFEYPNGNVQGYARGRCIAINPVAALPHKTRFHEIAHVVLRHTEEGQLSDDDRTPRDVREVEAESVAYILCSLLELPGLAESRGYVQGWLAGASITERSAQRIYKAADTIFRAGQVNEAAAA